MQCNIIVFTDYLTDVLNIRKLFSTDEKADNRHFAPAIKRKHCPYNVKHFTVYTTEFIRRTKSGPSLVRNLHAALKGATSRYDLINLS